MGNNCCGKTKDIIIGIGDQDKDGDIDLKDLELMAEKLKANLILYRNSELTPPVVDNILNYGISIAALAEEIIDFAKSLKEPEVKSKAEALVFSRAVDKSPAKTRSGNLGYRN